MKRVFFASVFVAIFAIMQGGCATVCPRPVKAGTSLVGTYSCPQGTSKLELRIIGNRENQIDAIFEFSVPQHSVRGSYQVSGKYDPTTRELNLSPNGWIQKPADYSAVGMSGTLSSDHSVYEGRITHERCGQFYLTRRD